MFTQLPLTLLYDMYAFIRHAGTTHIQIHTKKNSAEKRKGKVVRAL